MGLFAACSALVLLVSGCGAREIPTKTLSEAIQVGAMVPLKDGGIRFGERLSGNVWDIDKSGVRSVNPIARLEVSNRGQRGLLGLAIDDKGQTFASWTKPDLTLAVAQIAPGATRIIWNGPTTSDIEIGGRIIFTPEGRLLVGLGNMQDPTKISHKDTLNGKLLTLDPLRGPEQQPNIVSKNWNNPMGLAYMNNLLWAADSGSGGPDRLGRVGEDGFVGKPVELGTDTQPWDLTVFGDKELVVCMRNTKVLKRFLVNNVEPVSGRTVAKDCTRGVIELSSLELAYATEDQIRVTGK